MKTTTNASTIAQENADQSAQLSAASDQSAESTKTCVIRGCQQRAPRVFRKSGADIYLCLGCQCIMADIDYTADQYESADYYTMESDRLADIETRWGFRSRYILDKILMHTPDRPSLLDVGAGNGYFAHIAQSEYEISAAGIEISAAAVKFAGDVIGVELINGDVATHDGSYDVVTSFNVIEHVQVPEEHLAELLRLTKTGGHVVITTPNPKCIQRRVVGLEKWKMICPPHHINLFSLRALETMLNDAGLEIVAHETLSTYVKAVKDIDTESLLLRRMFFNAFRLLGMGADHFIIVKKK